ncbi:MAG: hypothetical protein KJI69_03235 [Patescibacteria group bacterium]|nr:hypothetical protein [Patescibacteria group bacterium]
MANKDTRSSRNTLIIFGILAGTILFLFVFTDLSTFFSVQTLSLDATSSQGKASDRGVDASTGIFRGKGFKGQQPPVTCLAIGQCPPSTDQQIVVSRETGENQGEGILGGGGAPSSTVGLEGFQTLFREDVLVFDRFHTPAKGQSITGTVQFDWGNERPLMITQVLIPSEFNSWFDFDLPQTLMGEGLSFDGRSDDEFKYTLLVPKNTLGNEFAVPIRFIVDSDVTTLDANALVEIEIPTGFSAGFSLAEFFRSLFASFRVG